MGSLAVDQNIAIRARVVLPTHAIAKGLGFSRLTVLLWQRRFKAIRVDWIDVRCSSIWARRKLMPEQVKAAVKATADKKLRI